MSPESGDDLGGIPIFLDRRNPEQMYKARAEITARATAPPDAQLRHTKLGSPTTQYRYEDADGCLRFVVARFEQTGGKKEIRPYDPEPNAWRYPDGPRPLYRLADILASDGPVIVVEGEKCVDALREHGFIATTNCGGSKAVSKTDWSPLEGRDVVLWPDNDVAGMRHAEAVAMTLRNIGAASVSIVALREDARNALRGSAPCICSDLPKGWDAADAIADGWDALRIRSLIERAATYTYTSQTPANAPYIEREPYVEAASPYVEAAPYIETDESSIGECAAIEGGSPASWKAAEPEPGAPPATPDPAKPKTRIPHDYRLTERGLIHTNADGEDTYICPPIEVVARTRDAAGGNWGMLVEFCDPDTRLKRLPIPAELLAGEPAPVCGMLLEQGLQLMPTTKARRLLLAYIGGCKPARTILNVPRIGWHDEMFVLPSESYGASNEEDICFQPAAYFDHAFHQAGSLEQWQERVAAHCVGNSRLAFAVSAGFVAPLLEPLGLEGGGFHFLGSSSIGKTTALRIAASVWGGGPGNGYIRNWRATANGLEATAHGHNHALLCLDELGQLHEREAAQVAYMLANGEGKSRARKNGTGKPPLRWSLLFLSTGEQAMADKLREAGRRIHAGQETRLIDVPADTGKGLGIFDDLRGFPNGATFARHLATACREHHGVAIHAFLERLTRYRAQALDTVKTVARAFMERMLPPGADGQVIRVTQRFALVAAAGELATRFGVLPWPEGTATRVAEACVMAWLDHRGGAGASEDAAALRQVRLFIQQNGESWFSPWAEGDPDRPTINRAGYRRRINGETEFLIFGEVYRSEVCAGMNHRTVTEALKRSGLLKTDSAGKATIPLRLPGTAKPVRMYVLSGAILGDASG